jgi:hypothetical protein
MFPDNTLKSGSKSGLSVVAPVLRTGIVALGRKPLWPPTTGRRRLSQLWFVVVIGTVMSAVHHYNGV